MSKLSPLSLERLRDHLRPELADMPAEDLEQIIESSISEVPQGIAEDFMKALGSLGKAVGPTLQRAAPGIAQGAATGASVGRSMGSADWRGRRIGILGITNGQASANSLPCCCDAASSIGGKYAIDPHPRRAANRPRGGCNDRRSPGKPGRQAGYGASSTRCFR